MLYTIEMRSFYKVNTDPQRRCYNSCHFSSEIVPGDWGSLVLNIPSAGVEDTLTWWRDLNAGAVADRGESARKEFRAVEQEYRL